MTKILLLFPFILIAMSCTVTKRVHRPGYHVVWHKEPREVQKQAPSDEFIFENRSSEKEKTENSHVLEVEFNQLATNETAEEEIKQLEEIEANEDDPSSLLSSTPMVQHIESTESTLSKDLRITKKLSARPIFWRIPPDTLILMGTLLMILGGLILLGVIFEFLGAFSGNGDGGWLNFFLDLFDVSGWFWLLIFLIIIIFVLYLLHLLIRFVLGGPIIALFIGLGLLSFGLFLFLLGQKRSE